MSIIMSPVPYRSKHLGSDGKCQRAGNCAATKHRHQRRPHTLVA